MAVNASSVATSKLEDQLTCAVCLDQYTDPRTLPCLHSFCVECLGGLPLDRKQDGTYTCACPTCRKVIDISQLGMAAFPKSFHLNNLIELQQELAKADLKTCESCEKNEATAGYCVECDKVLCTSCDDIHKKWAPFSTHKLVSIEERSKVKKQTPMNCPQHTKPLDLYCVTCEQLICYYCTIKGHKGHTHDLVSDVYEEETKQVTERLEELTEKITKIAKIKEELQTNQKQIADRSDERKKSFQKTVEAIILGVKKGMELGLQQLSMSTENKIKFEEKQVKLVDTYLNELIHCKQHVEQSLHVKTPTQLLSTKKLLISKMEGLMTSNECEEIEPLEEPIDEEDSDDDETPEEVLKKFSEEYSCTFVEGINHSEQFYEQCEFVPISIPASVNQNNESTGKFQVLFQRQPVIIDTYYIQCTFTAIDDDTDSDELIIVESEDKNSSADECNVMKVYECKPLEMIEIKNCSAELIECGVEICLADFSYKITFTPDTGNTALLYTLTLNFDGTKIDTKQTTLRLEV